MGSEKIRKILDELKEWDQSVLGFRKEHHFALSVGPSSGEWHFKRFGTARKSYPSSGIFSKFQYAFHIPWYGGFGYFLGSSAGYLAEDDHASQIDAANAWMLPGILGGVVYNFTPGLKINFGLDYYLERWSNLGERDGEGENPTVSVTARALDGFVALDLFFRLKWAIRFEGHRRDVNFKKPKNASGHDVDAVISKTDEWLGMGILYHLM